MCIRALYAMRVRFNLNGSPRFPHHGDVHLTYSKQHAPSVLVDPVDLGSQKYRVVQLLSGDVGEGIVHYSETWYTQAMWDEYEDECDSDLA